eukprot:g6277.t1
MNRSFRKCRKVNTEAMLESYLPKGFKLVKKLGRGGQATVLLAQDNRMENSKCVWTKPAGLDPARYDPSRVAVKCYPRSLLKSPAHRKQVRREIHSLRMLEHPHIIGLREVLLSRTHLCLVIEYAAGGTLFDLLSKEKTQILSESVARRFFQQLVTGVDYAHRRGVANRDIKPENILFHPVPAGKQPLLVLCDFGLARRDFSGLISRMEGTSGYIAPELFTGQCQTVEHAKQAEIYSCGVCLFQMLFGLKQMPLGLPKGGGGKTRMDMKSMRSWLYGPSRDLEFPELRYISEDCRKMLNSLLQPNPRNRITLEEIWEHPWFKNSLSEEAYEWNTTLVRTQSSESEQSMNEEVKSIMEEAFPDETLRKGCGGLLSFSHVFKKISPKTAV